MTGVSAAAGLAPLLLGLGTGDLLGVILVGVFTEAGDFPLGDFFAAGLGVFFIKAGAAFLGEDPFGVDSLATLAGDCLSGLDSDFLLEVVDWLAKMSGLSS